MRKALWLAIPALLSAQDYVAEGKRWWSHVEYLASDELGGRDTGSPGHKKAAEYVAQEFERAGLKPAGKQGYVQNVPFRVKRIDEANSKLELIRGGVAKKLELGDVANFNLRQHGAEKVEAEAVFAGHGLVIPEADYDELKGLDVRGKIVVYVAGGPPSIPSALKAHYSSRSEHWKALKKAGAIGTAVIQNPKSMDIPWERQRLARFMPVMFLDDASLDESPGQQFAISVNPARADILLEGTGHTMKELLAVADAGKPMPKFPLNAKLRSTVAVKASAVESQNVAGIFPGADPKLRDEFVVLTAHLDHVGTGEPVNGDRIYNGAMDNASGIASLIEIARLLKASGAALGRSVLFAAVTGEEKGLQGSRWLVEHPLVPRDKIAADINMDMFLPLFPLKTLEVQGLAESTLGDDIRAVAGRYGVQVQADKEPNRNLFIRSDQYSFIRRGIPALAFKFGFELDSPEHQIQKDWLKNRYHAPSDDVNQPVSKDGAAKFNHILLDLAVKVSNQETRPAWKPDSFFRRFAAGE